jgi:LPS O-antigen subunit length determinant protein (WzzB/FepE family)
MRRSVIDESDRTLGYLQREIAKTDVVEMRVALYRLMESHQRNKIAAAVREDYAFKIVDPPMPPDLRNPVFPIRGLFAALGLLAGALATGLFVLVRAGRTAAASGT